MKSGTLNSAITEAHQALRSARHVTDSLPIKEVLQRLERTNGLIKDTKIPWEELPEWRAFAAHALDSANKMVKEHPGWTKDLKETSGNIRDTASPIAEESKAWRESFKNVATAYAKTLKS